jgi:murein DD-endopeptidase MepM/ murein hydrolase activator NlpD
VPTPAPSDADPIHETATPAPELTSEPSDGSPSATPVPPSASPTSTPAATSTRTAPGHAIGRRPGRRAPTHENIQDGGVGRVRECRSGARSTVAARRECVNPTQSAAPSATPSPRLENADGTPTRSNPGYALATPGAAAAIGVPNFMIEKFRIPPFLLPIYQAAGTQYGIRWEILAAINEIETDYGRNLNISSAGALGWMQFMPPTWKAYGVDANRDGLKDPFNPVDAIYAAARYLRASGGDKDIRRAIFAYNHAGWYVESVLMRANVVGGLPSDLVSSLTGLTQGRFPLVVKATYAGQLTRRDRRPRGRNRAVAVRSDGSRKGIEIYARRGSAVIAVNDGKVVRIGVSKRLGRFVQLQDVYGNLYTYAHLAAVARSYPAPRSRKAHKRLGLSRPDLRGNPERERIADAQQASKEAALAFAVEQRVVASAERAAGAATNRDPRVVPDDSPPAPLGFDRRDFRLRPLREGSRVLAATVLGRIGKTTRRAPHLRFEIRPAGGGAPRIDPKPILDGWTLLESTAIYRAKGLNPFLGAGDAPSTGQIMLMSKETLARRVLANQNIALRGCQPSDVRSGAIDRRVLALLEFLASSGLKLTVSSMRCDHGRMTSSGNVSEHSTGDAVDIAAVNGIPIVGNQGKGSITELAIQRLLTLQGIMKPHQIISLMTFRGTDNTLAMADHDDHIHVGFRPMYGENRRVTKQLDAILKPDQWIKLIARLGDIDNPTVREQPSRFALKPTRRGASD